MSSVSFRQQLALLKMATVRTGAIHEAQALQLKNWPLLVPGVISAQAKVDVDRKMVTYDCKSKPGRITKKMKLTFQNVNIWTREILWDDVTVVFQINGKAAYDSRSESRSTK